MGFGKKLEHPGAVALDERFGLPRDAFELARFWVSPEAARSYVLIGYQERWTPELLGALLVESVHTAAAAYAARTNMSEGDALQRIWHGFDDERERLGPEPSKEIE